MTRRFVLACVAAVLLVAACGGEDGPGTVGLYDRTAVPAVPDRTEAIDPVLDNLGSDGDYWAELIGVSDGDPRVLIFDVTQALFADTCIAELGADECANDYGVVTEPHLEVSASITDLQSITVVGETQQNFAVTADELFALAGGATPAAAAPDDFEFLEFPFLLTVRGGKIVEAHQIWVP